MDAEGKVHKLDEEGIDLGVWMDPVTLVDTPKEKCKIDFRKITLPTEFVDQKLNEFCCIQMDSIDGHSTVCSKEKVRCWEDVRHWGRLVRKKCLTDRFEKNGTDIQLGLQPFKLNDEGAGNNAGGTDPNDIP